MSHPGQRSEQFAGNGSGGKRFFEKKSSKKSVNSRNAGPRNHADPAVVVNDNYRQQQCSTSQTNSSESAQVPIWFRSYMEMFLQQVTDDVTRKIMNYLELSFEDEATRARHKHSYFALKKRYNILENELAQERARNNSLSNYSRNVAAQNARPLSSENQTMGNHNGSHRYESQRRNPNKISPRTEKRNGPLVSPILPPSSGIKPSLKRQDPIEKKQTVSSIIPTKIGEKVSEDLKSNVSETCKIDTNSKTIETKANLEKVKSNSDNETLTEKTIMTVKCSQIDIKDKKSINDKIKNDVGKNSKLLNEDVSDEIECIKKNIVEDAGKVKDYDRKKDENLEKTQNGDPKNVSFAEKIKDEENVFVKNDDNNENEEQGNDTDLIGFVVKMQDLLMALTLENVQTIEEEITNFKNLTKWDIKRIVELFFEKSQDIPELSDSLAVFISKIVDLNPKNFDLPDMIISVCEKDFAEKIAEKIIFMGSLFKRSLLPATFMKKCIQHFTHNTNKNNVDHLCDLLDIVGETPEFWKIFNNQQNLPWTQCG